MKEMSAKELKDKLDSGGDFVLIDVLSKESFDDKHIPNSINIPVDEIEDRILNEVPDKGKEIIVYCSSNTCNASPTASKKLEEMGYTNIIEYRGGLAGWQEAGYDFE